MYNVYKFKDRLFDKNNTDFTFTCIYKVFCCNQKYYIINSFNLLCLHRNNTCKKIEHPVVINICQICVLIDMNFHFLVECEPFPSWLNIELDVDEAIELGRVIRYACRSGYEFNDNDQLKLSICSVTDGLWNPSIESCYGKRILVLILVQIKIYFTVSITPGEFNCQCVGS